MAVRKGTFLLSLDTELAWGSFDLGLTEKLKADFANTRVCLSRLLGLLERYQIKATFAFVGHLMLEKCSPAQGKKHENVVRPRFSWYDKDWFTEDPAANIREAPIWYGTDILHQILRAQPEHEIACHSFSHIIYGDPGCSEACAESDLAACVETAKSHGIILSTFIYPRNSIGHRPLLKKYGFTAYRGKGNEWYNSVKSRRLHQICHLADEFLRIGPGTSLPYIDEYGLCNTAGNMLYLSRSGFRRLIPVSSRVRKAIKGIDRAIDRGEIFHLWFHPHNLASDPDGLLFGLDQIFAYVRRKIDDEELDNCPIGELCKWLGKGGD
ncbi:MAG: hypothetical protein ACOX25_02700 [Caldicoprobacterales bacterium]|jgi:hypothetical protein|nr:polysaccharide deacetylase family protein [Clostridiales bacterium]